MIVFSGASISSTLFSRSHLCSSTLFSATIVINATALNADHTIISFLNAPDGRTQILPLVFAVQNAAFLAIKNVCEYLLAKNESPQKKNSPTDSKTSPISEHPSTF
jgi:hypothetical protein